MSSGTEPEPQLEKEHEGPIWKHPYFAYIVLTMLLFGFLVLMGWLALENGWMPSRGIGH
jgi:hypothetical protein